MKVRVSELQGAELDWAVAKCEGFVEFDDDGKCFYDDEGMPFEPSCVWAQGGPIIEREKISLDRPFGDGVWEAGHPDSLYLEQGSTPLIAAMRCYVASKLGDEVEIPEEVMGR